MDRERAISRGKRLIETRVGCNGCHGDDFGGKVLVDSPIVGYWAAPNLTSGEGSVTRGFTASDWDRAVRHGVRRNGQSSSMPSDEFVNLSDHELSDVVSYILSRPPVDRASEPVKLGPVFAFLVAFKPATLPAFAIDHAKAHAVEPPAEAPTIEFGEHIVQACRGCHGAQLSGGKIPGDPNMPIVANLTPHETGLRDWTEADFFRALREGKRKDGTDIKIQMPWQQFGKMSDVELKAVWAYLRTVPPLPKGSR
jgi:mono/diheme cytochrome c family protein